MWFQMMLSKGPFSWFHLRAPKWSVNIKHKNYLLVAKHFDR